MLRRYVAPLFMASMLLAGCQTPQGKFTAEQVATMKSYGFNEINGDWSLGLSAKILFGKTSISCSLKASSRLKAWQRALRRPA